jgi:hypothetical protein
VQPTINPKKIAIASKDGQKSNLERKREEGRGR